MKTTCIKCGFVNEAATGQPQDECPRCGVIYAKAKAKPKAPTPLPTPVQVAPVTVDAPAAPAPPALSLGRRISGLLMLGLIAWGAWSSSQYWLTPQSQRDAEDRAKVERYERQVRDEQLTAEILRAAHLQSLHNQVVDDAVAQYGIAKRQGSYMDRCVQAGFVMAAMLQAKNEAGYAQWKRTKDDDCAAAGMRPDR